MPITSYPRFANIPKNAVGVGTALAAGALGADTNGITVFTASATANGGSRCSSLLISTDDTAIVNVFIYIKISATIIPLGIISVPALSGFSATTPVVDALSNSGTTLLGLPIDGSGKRFFDVQSNAELKFSVLAGMTAAKKIYVTALYADITL